MVDLNNLEKKLNLEQMQEYEVSLLVANKYLLKLKNYQKKTGQTVKTYDYSKQKHISSVPATYGIYNINNFVSNWTYKNDNQDEYVLEETFNKQLNNEINKLKEEREKFRNISYDIMMLKTEIYKKNSLENIDSILSTIEYLNAELTDLRAIEKNSKNSKNITEAYNFKKLYDTRINNDNTVLPLMDTCIYTDEELKSKILSIVQTLNKLEEQRDKANVLNKIKIKLSKYSLEILGF
jgi:hypothetical protein